MGTRWSHGSFPEHQERGYWSDRNKWGHLQDDTTLFLRVALTGALLNGAGTHRPTGQHHSICRRSGRSAHKNVSPRSVFHFMRDRHEYRPLVIPDMIDRAYTLRVASIFSILSRSTASRCFISPVFYRSVSAVSPQLLLCCVRLQKPVFSAATFPIGPNGSGAMTGKG